MSDFFNGTDCTVYIWLPFDISSASNNSHGVGAYGHAAVQIINENDKISSSNYVSWWPGKGGAGMSDILPGRKKSAIQCTNFMADQKAERVSFTAMSSLSATWLRQNPEIAENPDFFYEIIENRQAHTFFGVHEVLWDYDSSEEAQLLRINKMLSPESLGITPKQYKQPWRINLTGLNRQAMIDEWYSIMKKENSHYRVVRKNCATIVARVLRAGGIGYSAGYFNSHHLLWTPQKIMKMCQKHQKYTAKNS
ncbi:hypothetical protein [Pelagibaculum spongiae]|uniref:DUF4105 domain-containing protein n=1 Tax=Pelagibaculum spongiae TaxID=2080658 RepID=A0A2V1GZ22_9GAMM|nr:hypothetical protein [Pelagibaculum spongiae]PVZ68306.1 hypothetical protein DC094_13545 [Pelagibaculum spongiae]